MTRPHLIAEIQDSGDHAVVVPECAEGRVLVVNPVAAAILRRCDGTATVEEITDHIAGRYGADRDRVHTDVTTLLQAVEAHGLLRSPTPEEGTAPTS